MVCSCHSGPNMPRSSAFSCCVGWPNNGDLFAVLQRRTERENCLDRGWPSGTCWLKEVPKVSLCRSCPPWQILSKAWDFLKSSPLYRHVSICISYNCFYFVILFTFGAGWKAVSICLLRGSWRKNIWSAPLSDLTTSKYMTLLHKKPWLPGDARFRNGPRKYLQNKAVSPLLVTWMGTWSDQ